MANDRLRRVWILGAGFSASLGCPLLNDLLSFRLRSRLVARGYLSAQAEGSDAQATQAYLQAMVYALYHHGTGYSEGYLFDPQVAPPRSERGLWRHAEDYLEKLDDMALDRSRDELSRIRERFLLAISSHETEWGRSPWFKTLVRREYGGGLPTLEPKEFVNEAKRIVAAECCSFLKPITANSERAKPYIRWLGRLGGQDIRDTLITFNYDCVVEKLAAESGRQIIVAGAGTNDLQIQEHRAEALGEPLLIKLHGSVDWERISDAGPDKIPFRQSADPEQATKLPDKQIATPGNSKASASAGELKPLWELAREKLRQAHEVIFIGYRMPESDAAAREALLDALEQNRNSLLRIGIVLGPPSFDRDRLKTLLSLAMPQRKDAFTFSSGQLIRVEVVDAWAQDYLQARRSK